MKINQEKKVKISPQNAYGGYNPKKVKRIPKGSKEKDLEEAEVVEVKLEDGRSILATVLEVTHNNVLLDFNHPLAGKKLFFTIKLIDIK
jgi:FKBP-type peptidyl-prolyl cis-trans isomerase 2